MVSSHTHFGDIYWTVSFLASEVAPHSKGPMSLASETGNFQPTLPDPYHCSRFASGSIWQMSLSGQESDSMKCSQWNLKSGHSWELKKKRMIPLRCYGFGFVSKISEKLRKLKKANHQGAVSFLPQKK